MESNVCQKIIAKQKAAQAKEEAYTAKLEALFPVKYLTDEF